MSSKEPCVTEGGKTPIQRRQQSLRPEEPPPDSPGPGVKRVPVKPLSEKMEGDGCGLPPARLAAEMNMSAAAMESLLFHTYHDQQNRVLQSRNFQPEPKSRVNILHICCKDSEPRFLKGQGTKQVECLLERIPTETCECHRLIVLMVNLEKSSDSTFGHKASISRNLAETISTKYDIHPGFMADMIGRTNYWSAVERSKGKRGGSEEFEFFCQHPRWNPTNTYTKGSHSAPCSVYMHYSRPQRLTLYIISAAESGDVDWYPSLLRRLGLGDGQAQPPKKGQTALRSSPFELHAILSYRAFEQSTAYVGNVRVRLMDQIEQVNNYSNEGGKARLPDGIKSRSAMEDRIMLESITKQLHFVSQAADTGIASAHMAIKVAETMLDAHSRLVMASEEQAGPAGVFIRDTDTTLKYIRDSFHCQKDWLTTYKARKDTAMNFVFNIVTQQDSATNVDISYKMSNDSSSMNAITILTLIFLPGTFLSTLFSSSAFQTTEEGTARTTNFFIPFVITGIILTFVCWCTWYYRGRLSVWRQYLRLRAARALAKEKLGDVEDSA
ncbi:hypothetical protein QBC39DRAFT_350048 [Podospora conica]|nr:hypothetical protein QBC39DRAFT_350048 [Schizothecium conicum]